MRLLCPNSTQFSKSESETQFNTNILMIIPLNIIQTHSQKCVIVNNRSCVYVCLFLFVCECIAYGLTEIK